MNTATRPGIKHKRDDMYDLDTPIRITVIGAGDGDNSEWVNMDVDEEEESDEDDQMGFVHKQPLVATGMAATLALLKGSGELGKSEELAGRAKVPLFCMENGIYLPHVFLFEFVTGLYY